MQNRSPTTTSLLALALLLLAGASASTTRKIAVRPDNVLMDYLAYRYVSILHFVVPENAVSAVFNFTVYQKKTGGLMECSQQFAEVHVKSASVPLVHPDGSKYKANLLRSRRPHEPMHVDCNGDTHKISEEAPVPGDWYLVAYKAWEDPNNKPIKQEGLAASCDTILDAELVIEYPDVYLPLGVSDDDENERSLGLGSSQNLTTALLEFYVPPESPRARLTVKSSCGGECTLKLHLGGASDAVLEREINDTETSLEFRPRDEPLHRVLLRFMHGPATNLSVEIQPISSQDLQEQEQRQPALNVTEFPLVRYTLPDFFTFNFNHVVGSNANESAPLNLSATSLGVMRFRIEDALDTGGTLSVGLKINDDEKKDNVVIVACVSHGKYDAISSLGQCLRDVDDSTTGADVYVANSSVADFVHVPYPETGNWHLSLRAFCLEPASPECRQCHESCARKRWDNGTSYNGASSGCDEGVCANCTSRPCDARVKSIVASAQCVQNSCGRQGRCNVYLEAGYAFSSCYCYGGYRGFDCSDDAYVVGTSDVLARLLLLTLSNLAFVGAIYVAVRRAYYTEALAYTAVLVFSTFYHACEGGDRNHSYCLMDIDTLQFCDFFNALLSIWMTLIAMASMGSRLTSFCHILGVIVLAVGAEKDRTALWVFMLPAVTGCLIVLASWGYKCRQKGSLQYPARRYRIVYLPLGLGVVFLGLVCYAFFQTNSTYFWVHSLWHVAVALGVVLLLPKREYMQ
ncbi:unnamed protein product [Trichogramma brassicae]|uniref:EGF-like domain-containing protein n=1 Tax=Trichogramma brassicae TaxID=86971 RepID=A0A6H5I9N6_9HYME|nr:unnamed protein product [Trichogramma brassicae]